MAHERDAPPRALPCYAAGAMRRPVVQRVVRLALSLVLGGLLAWMLTHGGLPVIPDGAAFEAVRPWTVGVYFVSLAVMHYLRAARWRHLLRPIAPVPLARVLSTAWLGFAAIFFFPLRMGEVVRPVLLGRRGPVRTWEAAGTVGAERIIDALCLALILLFAIELTPHLEPLPDHVGELGISVAAVPASARVAVAAFGALFIALVGFYAARGAAERLVRRVFGLVSPRAGALVSGVASRLAAGIGFLPRARFLAPFLLETAAYWAVNAFGLWLLAWGSGLEGIGFSEACTVMGVLGMGILLPAGPAYVGAFQLAVYVALAVYLPSSLVMTRGSAFVFLAYSCQFAQHALGALVAVALDRPRAVPAPAATRDAAAPAEP